MFDKVCPCGSNIPYQACCGKYHHTDFIAETPEVLMRSRYAAYAMANMAYIKKTMQGKPLKGFNEVEAEQWSKSVCWLGLTVVKSYQEYVEFIAKYLEKDTVKTIHEISEFKQIDHAWYYVDGKQIQIPALKVSRNSPCPCGSSKKFKHCHAA